MANHYSTGPTTVVINGQTFTATNVTIDTGEVDRFQQSWWLATEPIEVVVTWDKHAFRWLWLLEREAYRRIWRRRLSWFSEN